jgi:serine/threonine-protein kinase
MDLPMPAPVAPGTVLAGKYRIDQVLGEGGMGVVVAATDQQLERRVAIKFLLAEYAQHAEAAQRFLREARSAVKIQSEHVARVIDVGTLDTGSPYMVMEYLEGRDLSALIDTRQRISIEDAVAYVLEACDAIAEAHSVGIVHRDLKPANLFLALQPDGSTRIKVLDFGISKATVAGGATDPSLTRTSSMMGSPLYMSPEQMKSAKNVDPRTDVWALGVILYELLTLEPPFYAESIPELSAKVLLEEPTPIRSLRPEVPPQLQSVVQRALAKTPAARFETVADFATALAAFGPSRTRANVERASRVLRASGLRRGSVPEPPLSHAATSVSHTAAAWSESARSQSQVTIRQGAKSRVPLIGGAIALVAAIVGIVVFARSGNGVSSDGAVAPTTAAAASLAPVAPAPVIPKPATPAVETAAAVPAPAPPPSASAVPDVSPQITPPFKARPGHAKAPPPKAKDPAPPPAAPVHPVPAPAPVDPTSGFGNRK